MDQQINYIGVFLTFRCNLGCDYCLNKQGDFAPRQEISAYEWADILAPIETREDLPISLQGGEPTMHEGFYTLLHELYDQGKKIDLLTNGMFDVNEFIALTEPEMFKRDAPYASIRFSYHKNTNGPRLLTTVDKLQKAGYSVGIWGIAHPGMVVRNALMANACKAYGIDYREKEYLDADHGTYKYPDAVTGLKMKLVTCHPSEMLFAPDGLQYPCHHFLYQGLPSTQIKNLEPVKCGDYGLCNPCDVKLKTNRLQQGGHCSVRIEGA